MSIWDFSKFESIEDSSQFVKELIQAEVDSFNSYTNRKVIAEFGEIHSSNQTVRNAKAIIDAISETGVIYNNSSTLKNANKLYSSELYGFEIHDNNYKFRVFEIKISVSFPMEIILDSDIYEEDSIKMIRAGAVDAGNNKIFVGTKDLLVKVLGYILNNRKVIYIISRMLSENNKDE